MIDLALDLDAEARASKLPCVFNCRATTAMLWGVADG
jgi:hypothetical protein